MDGQPGVANNGARPGADRITERRYQRRHEHQRKDKDAEPFHFSIAPVDQQEQHSYQEGAQGKGFIKVRDRNTAVTETLFDDGDEMEHGSQAEGAERQTEKMFAPPHQSQDGVNESQRVERGGHTQPYY